jgi:hypothetical protein
MRHLVGNPDFVELVRRLCLQLAHSCPSLSHEVRIAFAAQLALAEERQRRGAIVDLHLYELGGRDN